MKIGLGIGIPRQQSSSGGGASFDTGYQALLDAASGDLPSASVQTAQNTLVVDLKAAGVWTKLDLLYVFATDGGDDIRRRNWKAPASFQATLSNSPTFTSLEGYTTNGSTSYLNTNFDLLNNASALSLDAASLGYYSRTTAGQNGIGMGGGETTNGSDAFLININGSNALNARVNGSSILGTAATNNAGFSCSVRTSATRIENFKNGASVGADASNNSGSLADDDIFIGCYNLNGTDNSHVNRQFSIAFIGGDISAEMSDFFTAIDKYMTAIGKNV